MFLIDKALGLHKNRIVGGATGHDDPRDWTMEAVTDDLMKLKLPRLNDPDSTLNQGVYDHTKSSCTIAGTYLQICQIFGKKATSEDLLKVVERCHTNMGYHYKGQYASTGANMAIKYWNAHNKDKILYVKINYTDPDLKYLLHDRNFLVGATYKGNKAYGRDYRPDGILNKTSFGASTYGHRTNLFKNGVFDSYAGGKRNEYRLGEIDYTLTELVKNGVYFPTQYVVLKEAWLSKDIKQIKEEQKKKRLANVMVNALSLNYQYLDKNEQSNASSIANKYRAKYGLVKHSVEKGKVMEITKDIVKELFTHIPEDKKDNVIKALTNL